MIQVPTEARREILHVCKRLYERGLVAGTDGNVSIRLSKEHLLATPTGMSKGDIGENDLVVCDMQGRQISGERRLTTEIKIHLAVYEQRDDICGVVHAHPPHATAFAVARKTMDERLMPEAYIAVGKISLTPYGTPSTDELEKSIRPAVVEHDSILLANHGAMTLGRDVVAAYHRMEALEQLARISVIAMQIGSPTTLTAGEMERLEQIRSIYGEKTRDEPCYNCGWVPGMPSNRPDTQQHGETARPTSYQEPQVHWSGNPPVWEKTQGNTSITEQQVRDLARRTLQELRDQEP